MTTHTDEPDVQHVRPFADFLASHDKGRTATAASAELHALISAVQAASKVGALVLKVQVKPANNGGDQMVVTVDIDAKPPRVPAASIFFVDGDGNLCRDNPDQPELPLKAVSSTREASL